MQNFKFMLAPKAWVFEGDENQVFRALELSDGRYLITWVKDKGMTNEAFYKSSDVLHEIAEGYWIVLEDEQQEKGE